MAEQYINLPVEGGGSGGIASINGDTTSAQTITGGTGISVSTSGGDTVITNTAPSTNVTIPHLYYVNPTVGNDANSGNIEAPLATIGQACTLIGSASSNTIFNDPAQSFYKIVVIGTCTESPTLGTRPSVVLDLTQGQLIGNLTISFNQGAIGGSGNQSPQYSIIGATLQGANAPYTGIYGNIECVTPGNFGSLLWNLYLENILVYGNISLTANNVSSISTLGLILNQFSMYGSIVCSGTTNGGITLKAYDCASSNFTSLGALGVTGAVNLYDLQSVAFDGPVVLSSVNVGQPRRWINVHFKPGQASDFSAQTWTIPADSISIADFKANVPTPGTQTFTLLDNALGVNYGPATPGNWSPAPSQVNTALDQLAARPSGGGTITALTGDVTASGSGSVAATLATVNSNVGSFTNASITVNAKGLITAASTGSSSGANTALSNLTSPTAVNQNLLFGTDATYDIGGPYPTAAARPAHVWASTALIAGSSGNTFLSSANLQLASSMSIGTSGTSFTLGTGATVNNSGGAYNGSVELLGTTPIFYTSSFSTAANPMIGASGDLTTGVYIPSAGTLGFTTGGVSAGHFDSSQNLNLLLPLHVSSGGTGSNTLTQYGVLVGDGASPFIVTAVGTTGQFLMSEGGSSAPQFAAVNLSTAASITGTLPAGNGGTGLTSPGTSGNVLVSNGSAWVSAANVPASPPYSNSFYTGSSSNYWGTTLTALNPFTVNGTPSLFTRQSSGFGTITAASGNQPGIAFTAPYTGIIEVTIMIAATYETTSSGYYVMTILETVTSQTVDGFSQNFPINGSSASNQTQMVLHGFLTVTASTAYNLTVVGLASGGTLYIGRVTTSDSCLNIAMKYV